MLQLQSTGEFAVIVADRLSFDFRRVFDIPYIRVYQIPGTVLYEVRVLRSTSSTHYCYCACTSTSTGISNTHEIMRFVSNRTTNKCLYYYHTVHARAREMRKASASLERRTFTEIWAVPTRIVSYL